MRSSRDRAGVGSQLPGGTTRCLRVALLAGTALTFVALPAQAQVAQTWNGSVSNVWSNGANWDSGVVPTNGAAVPPNLDSVTIDTVTPNPTVMTGGSANLNGLNVGFTGTGSLLVNGGAVITATDSNVVVGGNLSGIPGGGNGTVVVSGLGTAFNVLGTPPGGGMLVVGGSSTGSFTVQNGAAVSTVDSYVGFGAGSSGTATVTGATSTWTNSGDNYVGNQGTGVFNVLNAGTVNVTGNTVVGLDNTGSGTINISGTGSNWTTSGVTVLGGSVSTPGIGGTGTINISNGGTYAANNQMLIGLVGTGTVNITDGTLATTANGVFLGYVSGATGTLTVSGSTASWTDCGCTDLTIGGNNGTFAGGKGTVNVLNGGTVTLSSTLNLGRDNGTHTSDGTLNVSGANSTVTISVGFADALVVGRNGTGTVNITNGGVLTTDGISYLGYRRGATGAVVIDGTGSRWDATGFGVVVGGNDGTLTGGTGTVIVRNGGAFNSTDVLLGFDSAGTGSGTVTVTGSGSAWNATGSVSLGVGGTGTVNILDHAVFAVTGDLSVASCLCSFGTMNVSGQSTVTVGGAWSVGFDGSGTMTVTGSGTSVTAANYLTVGGFGTGTLTIQDGATVAVNGNGFGTSIIGQQAGASGTVTVTGAGSSLTFAGDLGINPLGGSSGALNVLDGGQVAIGGGFQNADRLTIGAGSAVTAGTYIQNSSGTATLGLRGTSNGRLNVSGTAGLDGALVITGHNAGRTTYTLVHSADLGGSTFNSVSYTDPLLRNPLLTYASGDVLLTVDPYLLASLVPTTANTNQQNVARAIDNALAAGATPSSGLESLFFLPGDALLNALTQVSGEPGAAVPTAGLAAMNQFINAMIDNAGGDGAQGGALGFADDNAYAPKRMLSPQQSDAYAAVTPRDRRAASFASRWNVWATGYGGNSTVSGNATTGSHTTSTRVYGTAVGAEYRATPDTRFGVALGGAGTSFALDSALGGGRADVFQAGAYARHQIGAAYLTGAVAYGWQNVTTDRTLTVSGTDKLRASFAANSLAARLEGGWRYAMPVVAVTPYAAAQTTAFYLPSYAESAISGSGTFALSYASKTVTATRAELGARFDKAMPLRDAQLTLRGRAAWAHDWNTDRSATATFQTLPGATFAVNGAQPAANAALVSAGVDVAWGNGWTVAANFDGEFASTTRSYAGRGSLKYAW